MNGLTLKAGMDIECGSFFSSNLGNAVNDGAVSEDLLDVALTHLFNVQVLLVIFSSFSLLQFRLGIFDPPTSSPYANLGPSDVNTDAYKVVHHDDGSLSLAGPCP